MRKCEKCGAVVCDYCGKACNASCDKARIEALERKVSELETRPPVIVNVPVGHYPGRIYPENTRPYYPWWQEMRYRGLGTAGNTGTYVQEGNPYKQGIDNALLK